VRAPLLANFLRRAIAPNATELGDEAVVKEFAARSLPAVVGCFAAGIPMGGSQWAATPEAAGAADAGCEVERSAFVKMSLTSHNQMFAANIREPALCRALDASLAPCGFVVLGESGTQAVFSARAATIGSAVANSADHMLAAERFVVAQLNSAMIEMTPDNSWEIISRANAVLIALLDPADKETFRAVSRVIADVQRMPEFDTTKVSIAYSWADSGNFASQFDIGEDELPNLVLYSSRTGGTATFHSKGKTPESIKPLKSSGHDEGVANVRDWLLNATGLRQRLAMEAKAREEANSREDAGAAAGPAAAGDKLNSSSPEGAAAAAVAAFVNQSAPGAASNSSNTSTTAAAAAPRGEDQEKVGEESSQDNAMDDWRNLGSLPDPGSFGQAWTNMLYTYSDLLEYQETYDRMSPAVRALDENMYINETLTRVYARLSTRPHWRLILDSLPRTPSQLQRVIQEPASRDKLFVAIQRLSALELRLNEAVQNQTESPALRNATLRLLAGDARAMHEELVALLHGRTERFLARFRREHRRDPTAADQPSLSIERRSVKDLSVAEFFEKYAKARRPVIITDLQLLKQPWTKAHLASKCGHHFPPYHTKDDKTHNWGGLVPVRERLNLTTFLETHVSNATRAKWYVHDWGLPRDCPEIMGPPPYDEFRYPRYFAGDYFQRMPFVGYQHSWPSLFVGANGTESKMHVDSGGTNFWLYLIEGVKEWAFFDKFDKANLYAKPLSAHFFSDVFRPDMAKNPLVATAPVYRGIQRPGELVFIPGGCPHGVRNLDDITGFSMNLLDPSNQWLYLWIKIYNNDFRDFELYTNPHFPRGMRSDLGDLTLGEFKSMRWYEMHDKFDIQ
jgi:hypothetical protein